MARHKRPVAVWGRSIGRSLSVQEMLEANNNGGVDGDNKQMIRLRHGGGGTDSGRPDSKWDGAVTLGRFLFALCHLTLAIILATLSFSTLSNNETKHADIEFHAYAEYALSQASQALQMGRSAAMTMASFTSESFPTAAQYPFVVVPGFERLANNLFKDDNHQTNVVVFAPIVLSDQLPEWEQFAYDYYYNKHLPHPFPNTTAVSSFGRGVWALDANSTASDQRYHDLGLECTYDCEKKILAPAFQMSQGPDPNLLFNFHSDPVIGSAMEVMMNCVVEKNNLNQNDVYSRQDEADVSCGALLPMMTLPQQDDDEGTTQGPMTYFLQPLRPAKNKTLVTGVIGESTIWLTLFNNGILPEGVIGGLDFVLSDQTNKYTFHVSGGKVVTHSWGDHHDVTFDDLVVISQQLMPNDIMISNTSSIYTLSVYPTKQFYVQYNTNEPEIALVVSLGIMLFISLSFYMYDTSVRKVSVEKNDFIDARQRFMRFVSHEVRTPLNAAVMGLDVISDAVETLSKSLQMKEYPYEHVYVAKECEEFVAEVKASCQHAADVLSDVLDYDDTERDAWMNVKVIPVWEFLNHVMTENRSSATDRGLSFDFSVLDPLGGECPQHVNPDGSTDHAVALCLLGDVNRLKQVLRNLVGNCVKFTPSGGSITVLAGADLSESANYGSEEGWKKLILPKTRKKVTARLCGKLHIKIKDTGEKYSAVLQRQLFGKKAQFNPDEKLLSGRGGGLSIWISKEIMDRHDGTLKGSSDGLEQGVEFKLILPLYQVKHQVKPKPGLDQPGAEPESHPKPVHQSSGEIKSFASVNKPSTNQLRLLIVDDAASNRKFLRRLLERKGHTCEEAVNGQEALNMIKEATQQSLRYDSILMDYEMPEMDGPTATKVIRSTGDSVYVVGVTGNMAAEDVNYFLDCGANVVLGKPLNLNTLYNLWQENGILSKEEPSVTEDDTDS